MSILDKKGIPEMPINDGNGDTVPIGLCMVRCRGSKVSDTYFVARSLELACYLFSKRYKDESNMYSLYFVKWVHVQIDSLLNLYCVSIAERFFEWIKGHTGNMPFLMDNRSSKNILEYIAANPALYIHKEIHREQQRYAFLPYFCAMDKDYEVGYKEAKEKGLFEDDMYARKVCFEIHEMVIQELGALERGSAEYVNINDFIKIMKMCLKEKGSELSIGVLYFIDKMIGHITKELTPSLKLCIHNKINEYIYFNNDTLYGDAVQNIYKEFLGVL